MIRNVFLDLDQTLFDFHRSEREAITRTLLHLGISPSEETIATYSKINDAQWKRLERREISREEVLLGRFALLFDALSVVGDPAEARRFYERALSDSAYFIDGAEALLEDLFGKYDLYLASNGTDTVQTARIAKAGIEKYFKGIFISQRIGYDKPSRKYFDACFERIENFKRCETVIVGDSMSSDILGGRDAGIYTCLYNPEKKAHGGALSPDFEINSLGELPDILRSIK